MRLVGFFFAIGLAFGQAQAKLEFEVASIRASQPGTRRAFSGGPSTTDPTRYTAVGAILEDILVDAYGLGVDRMSVPEWMATSRDHFELVAKVPEGATREQFRIMFQNLLAERFHLAAHLEKRNFTVYELTVAKGGLKMKESVADPNAPAPPAPVRANKDGVVSVTGSQLSMADIAKEFKRSGATIIDKTGLTGTYDLRLAYDQQTGGRSADEIRANPATQEFINAVQKQLGLQLQRTTPPLDFLVVDHADKAPTPN
jgi:uncharacterized protein (TIGR03435 family)